MTKISRWLAATGLAALVGAMLFGVAGVFGASEASAESPPARPARFGGTVTIDGSPAPAGVTVEARIGGNACGSTSVFLDNGSAYYVLDVPAVEPNEFPNCGTEGATVSFIVGGTMANETGTWIDYEGNELNLTVTTSDDDDVVDPTETPTEAPSDDDDATETPTEDDHGPTPAPPDTGAGASGSATSASWLLAALVLGAAGFGVAGATAARRR